MKNEDFLDELFEKARNEKDFMPPGEILLKGLEGSTPSALDLLKKNLGKILIGVVALAALLTVTFQSISNDSSADKQEKVAINSQTDRSEKDKNMDLTADELSLARNADSLRRLAMGQDMQDSMSSVKQEPDKKDHQDQRTFALVGKKKDVSLSGDINKLMRLQQLPVQEYEIDCQKDTILVAEEGTKFHIESYTFRNNRNQVPTGTVTLQIKECYTPYTFARENLSTCADSNILLETAGMFYMNVMQDKDTLAIRKGFEIGITPKYEVPERMDLYYGQRDSLQNIGWQVDPLGKKEAPLFISVSGKYARIMNSYFHKNYKLDKATMMALLEKQWNTHFTSDQRKIMGSTNCSMSEGASKEACEEFGRIAQEMALSDTFNVNSRVTSFDFVCLSKNKYAYFQNTLSYDTFRNYVPASDYRNVEIPLFFSVNTGWLNMDCPPTVHFKYRKFKTVPKNDVVIKIPEGMRVNATLFLNEQNSLARSFNTENGTVVFRDIPKDQKGILIITSLINDIFHVYRKEIDTDDFKGTVVTFEKIMELDDYLAWLKNATSTEATTFSSSEEKP
jgi:hypothetical protein